jgi:F-type H+-transporting ATPase subunit delta
VSSFTHPYARAFLESAPAGYDVDKFLASAAVLSRAVAGNPDLRAFLASPAITHEVKQKALAELAAKAGIDAFGARFFEVVLGNRRILASGEILKSLGEANDAKNGIVRGRATVASAISDPEREKIEEAVAARVGGKVRLAVDVDPAILAGFVAHVGSNVFDASTRGAIRRFEVEAKERTGA